MRFGKGHGTQNDFVILPDPDGALDLPATLVARLCDRRAGIGADGVLRVVQDGSGWFMDYRNADGSIAEMCGNGLRVFARYLLDQHLVTGPAFTVATRSGVRRVRAEPDGRITVEMGPARVLGKGSAQISEATLDGLRIDVGNPHLACLVAGPLDGFDLAAAPGLDPADFPAGGNVELVRRTGPAEISMRVHERGSGETRSCGTGAVAAAVAAAADAGRAPAHGR